MKLIQPAEISAKIMTIIDNAEKELYIISPYNKIEGWNKLINRIKKAQSREVRISWYSRKNNVDKNNVDEVRILGIEPILIDDLHAKLYMNENIAIFTSMNLSKISDEKSIDIGYITESEDEYEEIFKVFKKYIKNSNEGNVKNKKSSAKILQKIDANDYHKPSSISKHYYINGIHEHILNNYGKQDYNHYNLKLTWDNLSLLEYFDFKKRGYKLVFEPYDQAIKIYIYLPKSKTPENIKKVIYDNHYPKLSKENELDFNEYGNYVKYYFETFDHKIISWEKYTLSRFLKDLDILVDIVFSNK